MMPIVKDAMKMRGTPAKKAKRMAILATMTKEALKQYDAACKAEDKEP